jgi:hypothetical protein
MEDHSKEDDLRVDFLLRKKYRTPLDFTSTDQVSLEYHQRRKYGSDSSDSCEPIVSVNTPPERFSVTSGSNVSSVQSVYSNVVEDNRSIKRKWASVRLSDLEKEMEGNHSHFRAVSFYYAVFVNFIRFLVCLFGCSYFVLFVIQ